MDGLIFLLIKANFHADLMAPLARPPVIPFVHEANVADIVPAGQVHTEGTHDREEHLGQRFNLSFMYKYTSSMKLQGRT